MPRSPHRPHGIGKGAAPKAKTAPKHKPTAAQQVLGMNDGQRHAAQQMKQSKGDSAPAAVAANRLNTHRMGNKGQRGPEAVGMPSIGAALAKLKQRMGGGTPPSGGIPPG